MLKIGITGGIGSGKTTICKIFEMYDIPIYYADDRAKRLMTSSKIVKSKIKSLIGSEAYYRNGRLNRKYISSKVFNDNELLKSLNAIVHPAVGRDFDQWCEDQKHKPYVLKEAALLIESKSYLTLDKLILVVANEDIRIDRVMVRDGVSKAQVMSRIQNQMAEQKKSQYADFFIDNSGESSIIRQVKQIHEELIKLNSSKKNRT